MQRTCIPKAGQADADILDGLGARLGLDAQYRPDRKAGLRRRRNACSPASPGLDLTLARAGVMPALSAPIAL
jgi:hypothetical protein